MGWLDILVVTLINTIVCILLPRLLAIGKIRSFQALQSLSICPLPSPESKVTSFPYCTSHAIAGRQACKFSPKFCASCSSIH